MNKKSRTPTLCRTTFLFLIKIWFYKPATCFINLLLRLAALFLWIRLFFASRSIILTTFGKNSSASFLSVMLRRFLIAVRVDFLEYRFRSRRFAELLTLFLADFKLAIIFSFSILQTITHI